MTLPFKLIDFLAFETSHLTLHSLEHQSDVTSSVHFLYEDGTDIEYFFHLSSEPTHQLRLFARYFDDERKELAAICNEHMGKMKKWLVDHPSFRLYAVYDDQFITVQNNFRTLPIRVPYLHDLTDLETAIFLLDHLNYSFHEIQQLLSITSRDFVERRLLGAKDKLHQNPELQEKMNVFLQKQLS